MTALRHHLAACAAFRQGGNLQAALRAASEACRAAPQCWEAHYAYGDIWLALDEPRRAAEAFAAAVQLAQDNPEAWVNYGIARYRQGALGDAKAAMRRALLHAPDHPVVTANLGAFMRNSGESEAEEALLLRGIELAPENAGARLNLAADMLQERLSHCTNLGSDSLLVQDDLGGIVVEKRRPTT